MVDYSVADLPYSLDQFQIAAYGDDATTEEKDGFNSEEDFQWYINFNGVDYPAEAVYSIDFDPGICDKCNDICDDFNYS